MAFRVEIALRAFNDLDEIADYITKNGSFDQAEKWFNGIVDAIRTLEDMPGRFPVADVSEELGQEVRLLLYGRRNRKYKVYYSIQQETPSTGTVRVFHVRHWARKSLSTDEVRELIDKAQDEAEAGGDV
jgi:plasmid stabilization system protein ParE